MPAAIATHKFNSADADRFESNSATVAKLLKRAGLTPADFLMGLRHNLDSQGKFLAALESSGEWCRNYDIYYDQAPEEIVRRYGDED